MKRIEFAKDYNQRIVLRRIHSSVRDRNDEMRIDLNGINLFAFKSLPNEHELGTLLTGAPVSAQMFDDLN